MSLSLPYITPSRCVLLIGDDALYIYNSGLTVTQLVEVVPWSTASFEETVAEIISKECHSRPVLMLYDMVEQHYRKERMPKVGFLDKGNVLDRKLRIVFPQYKVRAALKLKDTGERGQPQGMSGGLYLFSAIPGNDTYKKVLEAVRRSMAPIAGFCLLPLESSDMVKLLADKLSRKAGTKAKWVVFMGQHQSGALRQIVIKNGELALTRMTPVVDTDIDAKLWSSEVVQEFNATMSYLSRFGYAPEDGLEVIVIANPEAGDLLSEKIETPCHLTTLTASEAARLIGIGIGKQEDERYADPLHASWAGRKRNFILPMHSQEVADIHKPRQVAMFVMLLLLAGMVYLAWQVSVVSQDLLSLSDQLDSSQLRLNQMEAQYQEEVERKKAMGFDVELVQGSLQAYDNLNRTDMGPLDLFRKLGQSLGSEMNIDSLVVNKVVEKAGGDRYQTEQQEEKIFLQAMFMMTMPASMGPTRANAAFESLRDRVQRNMGDATVYIQKPPYNSTYNVEVTGSEGVVQSIKEEDDYTPEMVIRRRVK
jgi:hypothetical protein